MKTLKNMAKRFTTKTLPALILISMALVLVLAVVLGVFLLGAVIFQFLWNYVIAAVFGAPELSLLQAGFLNLFLNLLAVKFCRKK